MGGSATHEPLRAALEFREQLASDKRRLAFFSGNIALDLTTFHQIIGIHDQ